jgi:hypothetical protein
MCFLIKKAKVQIHLYFSIHKNCSLSELIIPQQKNKVLDHFLRYGKVNSQKDKIIL